MADRNNFDYAGYAADNGYDWDDNLNGNQEAQRSHLP